MRNFNINRYSSASFYLKIGIAAIVLLLLSNLLLLYLFIKERNNNKSLFELIDRTSKDFSQIHESLKQKDMQKAFRYLTEAQKQVVAMLPAAPVPAEKAAAVTKEQQPAQPTQAKAAATTVASAPASLQDAPYTFVFADANTSSSVKKIQKFFISSAFQTASSPSQNSTRVSLGQITMARRGRATLRHLKGFTSS